ncbi:MAG: dephospho-CoA kinase [Deltaproteobacteria bacterium]|nr:dephospho-CoA kinase [Deltaproteobacteria bacterium]MBI3387416.1 dephospho-CoA kinase [Deltaproteobacteria bacterium]
MLIIGLTGGIGSGKSTVAKLLAQLGAEVIDADIVGHEVYRPGSDGWQQVVDAFGRDIVAADGSIDRKRLGAVVFGDPTALKRLTAIVHPLIHREVERRIAARRTAGFRQPIVVEAAVLIEANWLDLVDEVWLVVASRHSVLTRLQADRGMQAAHIEARIAAQLSDGERRQHADVVIENDDSLGDLEAHVRTAWARAVAA